MAETSGPLWLTLSSVRDPQAVAAKAAEAATRAATLNADAGNAQGYAGSQQGSEGALAAVLQARVTYASISSLPEVRGSLDHFNDFCLVCFANLFVWMCVSAFYWINSFDRMTRSCFPHSSGRCGGHDWSRRRLYWQRLVWASHGFGSSSHASVSSHRGCLQMHGHWSTVWPAQRITAREERSVGQMS